MTLVVRSSWLVRFAALAVVLGLFTQAGLGLPLAVRMAANPVAICSAGHDTGGHSTPVLTHDHEHCLLCHGVALPPLTPVVAALPVPQATTLAAAAGQRFTVMGARRPFAPRAPPLA